MKQRVKTDKDNLGKEGSEDYAQRLVRQIQQLNIEIEKMFYKKER